MSVKSRLKYQQAQKQGFKPGIPDGPEEEMFVDSFESSLASEMEDEKQVVPQVIPRKPSLSHAESGEQAGELASVSESEVSPEAGRKKRLLAIFAVLNLSNFFAVCRKIGSLFAGSCHYTRRIAVLAFEKAKSFQKSYLESITAEGVKENDAVPNEEISETEKKEEPGPTVAFTSDQIETTSRQLAELHQHSKLQPALKESAPVEKTVEDEEEIAEEEDLFDEDDFDAAVRRARLKLVATAALVFFCVGGFLAYQFFSSRSEKPDAVAIDQKEDPKPTTQKSEEEPSFFPLPQSKSTSQLATVNPPVGNQFAPVEEPIPGFDEDFDDLSVATAPTAAEESDIVDSLDIALNDSTQKEEPPAAATPQFGAFAPVETGITGDSDSPEIDLSFAELTEETEEAANTEIPTHNEPPTTMNAGLPGQTEPNLSLQSSVGTQPAKVKQTDSRLVLQGETQGAKITIPNSPAANLPLPRTSALAEANRSAPAAPFASRFEEEETDQNFLDEELSAPILAQPNRRYETDASLAAPRIDETAIRAAQVQNSESGTKPLFAENRAPDNSKNSRRPKSLPFDPSRNQPQILAEAGTSPKTAVATPTKNFVKNDWQTRQVEHRTYIVQEGDNLFNIAKRELGKVTRWNEIKQLNKETLGQNAEYLTPGIEILLPE